MKNVVIGTHDISASEVKTCSLKMLPDDGHYWSANTRMNQTAHADTSPR